LVHHAGGNPALGQGDRADPLPRGEFRGGPVPGLHHLPGLLVELATHTLELVGEHLVHGQLQGEVVGGAHAASPPISWLRAASRAAASAATGSGSCVNRSSTSIRRLACSPVSSLVLDTWAPISSRITSRPVAGSVTPSAANC